jgi:hypothetical protein
MNMVCIWFQCHLSNGHITYYPISLQTETPKRLTLNRSVRIFLFQKAFVPEGGQLKFPFSANWLFSQIIIRRKTVDHAGSEYALLTYS